MENKTFPSNNKQNKYQQTKKNIGTKKKPQLNKN